MLEVEKIRKDFPVLSQKIYGNPLVYLDNAATTQKPLGVIDAIAEFYKTTNSNIHRGIHLLSEKSTEAFETSRKNIADFIGASSSDEIIFTAGTTASINTVAFSFGEKFISEGDEIILSRLEHHSNIVPWQLLAERKKAIIKVIPINSAGEIVLSELENLFTNRTKILAVSHISNSLGTINPIEEIIKTAHSHGVPVLVDGAQSVQHGQINVKELDCDFYVFSGHKIYGPTGIGILYGKEKWLEQMPPYQGGGDMIKNVSFERTTFNNLPFKFEAGTMNFAGAIGLSAAINYVKSIGLAEIATYEKDLLNYATAQIESIEGLRIIGTSKNKAPVISFIMENIHPYDTGMILDKMGVAVRTGTHCTEPVMAFFNIDGTVRASFSFYNTFEEIDVLTKSLFKIREMFG